MDTSIFLARFFGLYFLIMVVAMVIRRDQFLPLMRDMLKNSAVMGSLVIIAIIGGLLLVLVHNVWVLHWEVIITILCWWILIKGCIGLYFPKTLLTWGITAIENPRFYYAAVVLYLILGLFLVYQGFFA